MIANSNSRRRDHTGHFKKKWAKGILRDLLKKINFYFFKKKFMCRQNSKVRLLPSNINYQFKILGIIENFKED